MSKFDSDYARVEAAIKYIETQATRQPSLDNVAEYIALALSLPKAIYALGGSQPEAILEHLR